MNMTPHDIVGIYSFAWRSGADPDKDGCSFSGYVCAECWHDMNKQWLADARAKGATIHVYAVRRDDAETEAAQCAHPTHKTHYEFFLKLRTDCRLSPCPTKDPDYKGYWPKGLKDEAHQPIWKLKPHQWNRRA